MKMVTMGVDCVHCVHYKELSLLKCECTAKNKTYWIGHKIQCDDMEVKDENRHQEDE